MENVLVVAGIDSDTSCLLNKIWVRLLQAQHFFSKKNIGLRPGDGLMSLKEKKSFWKTSGRVCVYCSNKENLTIDHVLARCMGGTNQKSNLQVLCESCNKTKSTSEKILVEKLRDEDFRNILKDLYIKTYLEPRQAIGKIKKENNLKQREEAIRIIAEQRRIGLL